MRRKKKERVDAREKKPESWHRSWVKQNISKRLGEKEKNFGGFLANKYKLNYHNV